MSAINKDVKAFPVYLKKVDSGYAAWNENVPISTQGQTLEEALYMAKDAIELMAYDYYCDGEKIIEPEDANVTEEDYDFKNYVVCDLNRYFRLEGDKKVKKNCTIPESLAKAAISKGINFSKTLTYALEKEIELV